MKMITSKTCTKCRQFKKLIADKSLPVDVEDIEDMNTWEYNELMQSGIMSLPVLVKDDQYIALSSMSAKQFEETVNVGEHKEG